jgi:hypothetical protein
MSEKSDEQKDRFHGMRIAETLTGSNVRTGHSVVRRFQAARQIFRIPSRTCASVIFTVRLRLREHGH